MRHVLEVLVCSAKIEKEKKQLARDAGFVKTEVSGAEVCVLVQDSCDSVTSLANQSQLLNEC